MIPTCVVSLQPPAENVSQNNVLMQEMSTPLDQPSTYGKNSFSGNRIQLHPALLRFIYLFQWFLYFDTFL